MKTKNKITPTSPPKDYHPTSQGARLCLDFPSREALAEWVEKSRGNALPADSAVFEFHDEDRKSVTQSDTFIVRRKGSRPDQFRLHITTTETTVTAA